jgi:hypothetical protein
MRWSLAQGEGTEWCRQGRTRHVGGPVGGGGEKKDFGVYGLQFRFR